MTATAELQKHATITDRPDTGPILMVTARDRVSIRAGTTIEIYGQAHAFDEDTEVHVYAGLAPGQNYGIYIGEDGEPFAALAKTSRPLDDGFFAGFHYAPSGNAVANEGGDGIPAINPASLWDVDFRPACADPRGMVMVETHTGRFWVDIYLLDVNHHIYGTSRCGAVIANGHRRPWRVDGDGKGASVEKFDYKTAVEIYASHGKRLLGAEEFFVAAYGVKERCSRDDEPETTGSISDNAKRFISRHGLFDVAGTMWQWGTDGHPDDPRPSIFGGSWFYGVAGSRCANLDYWPGDSNGYLSARGACGHL